MSVDPYGTIRAQVLDLQGNATGGAVSNNDWRLVVDNESLIFQHYDATANNNAGAYITRQSFGTGLTGISVVPLGTYSITGNLQVTDDLTVDGGTLFVDSSTNRVGFGTLTPSQVVHVVGNTYVDGDLTVTGTASISSSSVWTKDGATNEITYTVANVGIGTSNPDNPLHVNGTSKFVGNMTMTGHIIPSADNTYDLGSASNTFRHVYVGPGSLYVNGKQVITDDSDTITISTDINQNLALKTSGSGNLQISTTGSGDIELTSGGIVQMKKTLQILDGQKITSSGGTTVVCGNNFQSEGSLRGVTLTLDGSTSIGSAQLNVLADATVGTAVAFKAVVLDTNKDFSGIRNLSVTGNLTILGTTTTVNSTTVAVADGMFQYASNNAANVIDMGWYGKYVDSSVTYYAGMFRDATDNKMRFFTSTQVEPATTVDIGGTGYAKADVVVGDIDFTSGTMRGHIIPDTDDAYDIGSSEFKIRDMFVSESSLWVGDNHKITIDSGGKMKFRKRKTTTMPAAVTNAGGTEALALQHSGKGSLGAMKLKHWKAYMRTLSGQANAKIKDIFRTTSDDYDEEQGADSWLDSGNNVYLGASGNVGIGNSTPTEKLDVRSASAVAGEGARLGEASIGTWKTNTNFAAFTNVNVKATGTSYAIIQKHDGETFINTALNKRLNFRINSVDKMVINGNNVGINQYSPAYTLDVTGDINFTGTLRQNGSAYGGGSSVWTTVNTDEIHYSGGNVGIGTNNPVRTLHLYSGGTSTQLKITTSNTGHVAGDGIDLGIDANSHGFLFNRENKDLRFGTNTAERMRILAGGNVGIGTNNPGYLLHLHRAASASVILQLTNNTTGSGTSDGFKVQLGAQGDFHFIQQENADLAFHTNNSEKMRLLNSGNLGIGVGNPAYTLDVAGDINFSGSVRKNGVIQTFGGGSSVWSESSNVASYGNATQGTIKINSNDSVDKIQLTKEGTLGSKINHAGGWKIQYKGGPGNSGGATGAHSFYTTESSAYQERMSIISNGNVGIGTTAPNAQLHVYNQTAGGETKLLISDDNLALIQFKDEGLNKVWNIEMGRSATSGDLTFYDSTGIKVTFEEGGNVGIGTINPNSKLHVYDGGDLLKVYRNGDSSILDIGYSGQGSNLVSTTTATIRLASAFGDSSMDYAVIERREYGPSEKSELLLFSGNDQPDRIRLRAGEIHFDVYSGVSSSRTDESIKMSILNSGNVGIGDTTPSYKLDVNGTCRVTGVMTIDTYIGRNAHNVGHLCGGYNNIGANDAKSNPIYTIGSGFRPAETTLASMYGIGYCNDSATFTASTGGWGMYVAEGGNARIFLGAAAGGRTYFNTTGNFGIGTDNPVEKLDVNGCINITPGTAQSFSGENTGECYIRFAPGTSSNDWAVLRQIGGSNAIKLALDFHDDNNETGFLIRDVHSTQSPDLVYTRFMVERGGNVGIGTNNPSQRLHLRGNYLQDETTHSDFFWRAVGAGGYGGLAYKWSNVNGQHNSNLEVHMHNTTGSMIMVGYIENDNGWQSYAGNGRFNDFTGQHRCIPQSNVSADKFGLIVYSTGKYVNIDNSLKPTMNDSLPVCDLCSTENDPKVFGVISDDRDDNSDRTIGWGVFKTVQQKANTNETRIYINSVGEGGMWVCDKNGNVSNGSYISCSSVPGYGMKQDSVQLVNSTVAKITCDCNFSLTPIVKQKVKVTETIITKQKEVRQSGTETDTEIVFENGIYKKKSVSKTTNELVYDSVPLYDDAGVALVDSNGNAVMHKIQRMEDYTETTTQLVLDSNGDIQYEDDLDVNAQQQMEYEYDTRFLNADATLIATEAEYNTKKANGENVYIAQFIGCTYHCG